MRLPPGVSRRKLECPSQVRVASGMAPILERIVRLRREATAVLLRLAPATLGLLAVVLSSVGANGAALGVLLLAGPFAAAAGLYVVLQVVDHERSRASALPAALSLLLL